MGNVVVNVFTQKILVDPISLSTTVIQIGPQGPAASPIMSFVDRQTEDSYLTLNIGTIELPSGLVSDPFDTVLDHCYKISFMFQLKNAQELLNNCIARVRRGSSTGGVLIFGPVALAKRSGDEPIDTVPIIVYDVPGEQVDQQWVLTLQSDDASALIDVYNPSYVIVEDFGLYPGE